MAGGGSEGGSGTDRAPDAGRRGDDGTGEALARVVSQHLFAEQLRSINPQTPEGLASLTAVLTQALQVGLEAGNQFNRKEARKAAAEKKKKKKRDERAQAGEASPRALEKQRRKEERDELRKKKVEEHKKEQERKKLPFITLADSGIPSEMAYTGAKSTIKHIVSTNFARRIEWGTISKAEHKRVIAQVKGAFQNGGELDSQWIADKISNSMSQARYHDRMKIRSHLRDLNVYRDLQRPLQFSEDIWKAFYESEVQLKAAKQLKDATEQARRAMEAGKSDRDLKALEAKVAQLQKLVEEVGPAPSKFIKATERVALTPNSTHKLGQGGLPGLKSAFVSSPLSPKLLQSASHYAPSRYAPSLFELELELDT